MSTTRETGKYGKLLLSTAQTLVASEVAVLNTEAVIIGGRSYGALRVATLVQRFVIPDAFETPITIVLAVGTGSPIPSDISYVIDYVSGRIIFDRALTTGNTVTVSYHFAASFIDVANLTEWSFDAAVKEVDVTAFNDEWEQFLPLQKNWTASITGSLNIRLWDAFLGATDNATEEATKIVYVRFFKNRGAVGTTNPCWAGAGLVSFSMKTPYAGKVDFTAAVKGCGALVKLTA